MIYDRLALCRMLLTPKGMLCATIDDCEQRELHYTIGSIFGEENIAGTVVIRANPSGRPIPTGFGIAHEYAVFARKTTAGVIGKMPRTELQLSRYNESDKDGRFMWELFRKRGSGPSERMRPTMYYPLYSKGGSVRVQGCDGMRKSVFGFQKKPTAGESILYPIDGEGV